MGKNGTTQRKNKKYKVEATSCIDTALTILDTLPKHDEDMFPFTLSADVEGGVYPLSVFKELFDKLTGSDGVRKILAGLLATITEPLEIAVKGVLLANLQELIQDCSLNIKISEDLIKNGIVFDLRYIDLLDLLEKSPLSDKGKMLYHDCEEFKTLESLKDSTDFNALLYYVKQKSSNRVVWANPKSINANSSPSKKAEERDKNAIVTLDFVERPSMLKNNAGDKRESGNAYGVESIPYNNCLQLFLGNAMLEGGNGVRPNRYLGKTVMEFNRDFVKSIKLFDAKNIMSQVLMEMYHLPLQVDASFKLELLNNEIEKIIEDVIHNDNIAVSDCFFTFSNEEYDAMLQKAEMSHYKGMPFGGIKAPLYEELGVDEILSELNNVSPNATQEEILTFLEGSERKINAKISEDNGVSADFNLKIDGDAMLDAFLDALCKVVIKSFLTPKVYILLLTNRAIMGDMTDFRFDEFLTRCKNLFMHIITNINDIILEILLGTLTDMLKPLASKLFAKLTLEQMAYWNELLRKMIDCIHRKMRTEDFDIANVQYADIYNNDIQPTDVEC